MKLTTTETTQMSQTDEKMINNDLNYDQCTINANRNDGHGQKIVTLPKRDKNDDCDENDIVSFHCILEYDDNHDANNVLQDDNYNYYIKKVWQDQNEKWNRFFSRRKI